MQKFNDQISEKVETMVEESLIRKAPPTILFDWSEKQDEDESGGVASESSEKVVDGVTQVSERAKRLMWQELDQREQYSEVGW